MKVFHDCSLDAMERSRRRKNSKNNNNNRGMRPRPVPGIISRVPPGRESVVASVRPAGEAGLDGEISNAFLTGNVVCRKIIYILFCIQYYVKWMP